MPRSDLPGRRLSSNRGATPTRRRSADPAVLKRSAPSTGPPTRRLPSTCTKPTTARPESRLRAAPGIARPALDSSPRLKGRRREKGALSRYSKTNRVDCRRVHRTLSQRLRVRGVERHEPARQQRAPRAPALRGRRRQRTTASRRACGGELALGEHRGPGSARRDRFVMADRQGHIAAGGVSGTGATADGRSAEAGGREQRCAKGETRARRAGSSAGCVRVPLVMVEALVGRLDQPSSSSVGSAGRNSW